MKQKKAELQAQLDDANKRISKLEDVVLVLNQSIVETDRSLVRIFNSLGKTIKGMLNAIGGIIEDEKRY